MARVELTNVTKIYDNKVTAINEANLTVEDEEFVVLVGPSGCGKSTLLRMIAGLEDITAGEIRIDNKIVNHVSPKDRDISMVFQNYALYPHMTVYENMAFGLKLRKFSKVEIKKRVNDAAGILNIEELLGRKPKALSGGQRQRVALGRAIVRNPKVFLFDEPLSNLDAKLRVQMRIEINRLHGQLKSTMIYVTHDQIEAMTMGDRIVILKDGVIQQVDSPLNLYNDPANLFVAGFIGSPSMNFFTGQIMNENGYRFKNDLFDFTLPQSVKDKLNGLKLDSVILGIRPEHIKDITVVKDNNLSETQKIQVDVIEPVGNEVFVYFKLNDISYCMRMPPEKLYKAGDDMEIGFDLNKLFLFDPNNENRIY